MSTGAITVFVDEDGTELVVLYRHWDGYPLEHGQNLTDIIADIEADEMSDLAVQVITQLKDLHGRAAGSPNFYLYPFAMRGLGEEFIYTVQYATRKVLSDPKVVEITVQALHDDDPSAKPLAPAIVRAAKDRDAYLATVRT